VTDQGIRYITQGNGSSVAGVLIDAVNKWNERNPDKTVLYLNYARSIPTSPTTSAASGTSASTPTAT
jgi:branched-chain amino acid transport system substrate-binding protein